jgi:hypothetical protein
MEGSAIFTEDAIRGVRNAADVDAARAALLSPIVIIVRKSILAVDT